MNPQENWGLEAKFDTNRRREVIEMHLFDEDATEEKALCEVDTSAGDRRGVRGYMEDRLHGLWVGAVCEGCKAPALPFAVSLVHGLESEDLLDEAEEYCQLADTLSRETGLNLSDG